MLWRFPLAEGGLTTTMEFIIISIYGYKVQMKRGKEKNRAIAIVMIEPATL